MLSILGRINQVLFGGMGMRGSWPDWFRLVTVSAFTNCIPPSAGIAVMTFCELFSLREQAEFVVTDGGSVQEECSSLGIPCFLFRMATERREGLGFRERQPFRAYHRSLEDYR